MYCDEILKKQKLFFGFDSKTMKYKNSVACRQFEKGMSIEETSKVTQHPIELVEKWYEQYKLNSFQSSL